MKIKDLICHAAVMQAYRATGHSGQANLLVHQYQTVILAMGFEPTSEEDAIYCGPETAPESEDAFAWKRAGPPSTDLEKLALLVYMLAVYDGHNHAIAHVAVAAIFQLSRLVGETWAVDTDYYVGPQPAGDIDALLDD